MNENPGATRQLLRELRLARKAVNRWPRRLCQTDALALWQSPICFADAESDYTVFGAHNQIAVCRNMPRRDGNIPLYRCGGIKESNYMIPLSRPDIRDSDIAAVSEILRTDGVSIGPAILDFERALADRAGTKHAVSMNSGTSSLHTIVRALGLTKGDCVLTTSFSFIASSNCCLYEGVLPYFVDIDPTTYNLDPVKVEEIIQNEFHLDSGVLIHKKSGLKLRAILAVDVFGVPCDYDLLQQIAKRHGLALIEDSCEALGSRYFSRAQNQWQPCGSLGDAGCFGFYANKQLVTGEGGAVVTSCDGIASHCRSVRNHGRKSLGELSFEAEHTSLGFNYRMSAINCALGTSQLRRFDETIALRKRAYSTYISNLEHLQDELILPHAPSYADVNWFVFVVQLRDAGRREKVMAHLRSNGIQCARYFVPIHQQPHYQREIVPLTKPALPVTDQVAEGCVALPFYAGISTQDAVTVCSQIEAPFRHS